MAKVLAPNNRLEANHRSRLVASTKALGGNSSDIGR